MSSCAQAKCEKSIIVIHVQKVKYNCTATPECSKYFYPSSHSQYKNRPLIQLYAQTNCVCHEVCRTAEPLLSALSNFINQHAPSAKLHRIFGSITKPILFFIKQLWNTVSVMCLLENGSCTGHCNFNITLLMLESGEKDVMISRCRMLSDHCYE